MARAGVLVYTGFIIEIDSLTLQLGASGITA